MNSVQLSGCVPWLSSPSSPISAVASEITFAPSLIIPKNEVGSADVLGIRMSSALVTTEIAFASASDSKAFEVDESYSYHSLNLNGCSYHVFT